MRPLLNLLKRIDSAKKIETGIFNRPCAIPELQDLLRCASRSLRKFYLGAGNYSADWSEKEGYSMLCCFEL